MLQVGLPYYLGLNSGRSVSINLNKRRKHFPETFMARACFPSVSQYGKHCFQCQVLFPRCDLCFGSTKIRACEQLQKFCEHSSNFCNQFEQRPNFFEHSHPEWDHSIPLIETCLGWPKRLTSFLASTRKSPKKNILRQSILYFIG